MLLRQPSSMLVNGALRGPKTTSKERSNCWTMTILRRQAPPVWPWRDQHHNVVAPNGSFDRRRPIRLTEIAAEGRTRFQIADASGCLGLVPPSDRRTGASANDRRDDRVRDRGARHAPALLALVRQPRDELRRPRRPQHRPPDRSGRHETSIERNPVATGKPPLTVANQTEIRK